MDANDTLIVIQDTPKKPKPRALIGPLKDELTCMICREIFIKATTLNCKHSFCFSCISLWRKNNNVCPYCKSKITLALPSLVIDNLCNNLLCCMTEEDRVDRKNLIKMRNGGTTKVKTAKPAERGRAARRGQGRGGRQIRLNVNGLDENIYCPGGLPYFGGYGNCIRCHQPGHWVIGCPNRR